MRFSSSSAFHLLALISAYRSPRPYLPIFTSSKNSSSNVCSTVSVRGSPLRPFIRTASVFPPLEVCDGRPCRLGLVVVVGSLRRGDRPRRCWLICLALLITALDLVFCG